MWTAGNAANPLVASLALPNRGGRLLVNEYLEVENAPGIWALGDCVQVPNPLTKGFHCFRYCGLAHLRCLHLAHHFTLHCSVPL